MPTSNDNLLAAFSYWGSLVFGCIPALVIYYFKRRQSDFIRHHALQGAALNLVGIGLILVAIILMFITFQLKWVVLGLLLLTVLVIFYLIFQIYILYLGIQVFQGEDPQIPWLSNKIKAF